MNRTLKIGSGIAIGAAAVAVAGMMATASPVATSATTADPTPSASADAGRVAETPLTGDNAAKAKAAAEAAVPGGTILRVETDSDGTYEAHVRKSDGTEVEVKMDKDFTVTSVEEFQGRGGHGGPGNGETPLTGDDATKAKAAAEAAVSGGTVLRVETDSDGTYEAHVRKSDGTEVEVKMDKDFTVTSVEEFQGRGGHGGPGNGETPLTGDDATKAKAAAEAAVSGGTVLRVETDSDGTYEAHVRKSDGSEVEVKMDKDFTVTSVEEFQGRGDRGAGGAEDDSTASATPSA